MTNEMFESLSKQAQQAYQNGNYTEAAALFTQAARQAASTNNPLKEAELANNSSVALLQAGQAQAALDAALGTDQVFAAAGDVQRQALALGNQAAALEAIGRLDEAMQAYRQCADLLKQTNDKENRAAVLKSISALQIRTGHQLEAVASMDAALDNKAKLSTQEKFLKKLLNIPMRMLHK